MGFLKFCSDMIFEILSQTSLKSLDRCKSVCKEWNDISYESSFVPLHRERTNIVSGYYLQNHISNKYVNKYVSMDKSTPISLDFLPRSMRTHTKIVASSRQGILCCLSQEHKRDRFYICKPSTQQWRAMPNPKMRYVTKHIAILVNGSDPLRYKIFRLSKPAKIRSINTTNFHCEIFDSEKCKWKKLRDVLLTYEVFIRNQSAVVISGSIYWLLTDGAVLNFNMDTETYTIFPSPLSLKEEAPYFCTKRLVEYKGNLAYVLQEERLMVWVLEDSRRYVWGQRKALSLKVVKEKERYASCIGFSSADVAVMASGYCVMFYDFRNSRLRKIDLDSNWKTVDEVFVLRSDLETIEL